MPRKTYSYEKNKELLDEVNQKLEEKFGSVESEILTDIITRKNNY